MEFQRNQSVDELLRIVVGDTSHTWHLRIASWLLRVISAVPKEILSLVSEYLLPLAAPRVGWHSQ